MARLLSLFLTALVSHALEQSDSVAANPIRKVVTMMQSMQKKIEAEGDRERELFNKFMCYCRNSDGELGRSIEAAEKKVPELEGGIKKAQSQHAQLKLDLTQARADREAAQAAMKEATILREKEVASFTSSKTEWEVNIAAMGKAVDALEKGSAGAFLQTDGAEAVRKAVKSMDDMDDSDRQDVLSFLSGSQGGEYAPQGGQITGILKQMSDTMQTTLEESTKAENAAAVSFSELMAAKTKEAAALTAAIEEKSVREGETAVSVVEMKGDLTDTEEALAEDKKFSADLEKNCANKQQEWDGVCKARSNELSALSDTIKLLNDDDALELFKKTLPGASSSFLQVGVTERRLRMHTLNVLREIRSRSVSNRPDLDFIMLSLSGKSQGFDFIKKKIENMIGLLHKEQDSDDAKVAHCKEELHNLAEKKKHLEQSVSDHETRIAEGEESLATLNSEIKSLEDGIVALDKSVVEATEQRKEEHADYTALIASDSAAKEILGFAKNRLNKFYNPTQYHAPKSPVFVQISAHEDDFGAPPPPPETFGAYTKKSDASTGVIGMIDGLVADLTKEMTEAKKSEEFAQQDYEVAMKDSAAKRSADAKSIAEKVKAKAEVESELQEGKENKMAQVRRLMENDKLAINTHGDCDFLLQNYETRKEARAGEIASLNKNTEVLNGANE